MLYTSMCPEDSAITAKFPQDVMSTAWNTYDQTGFEIICYKAEWSGKHTDYLQTYSCMDIEATVLVKAFRFQLVGTNGTFLVVPWRSHKETTVACNNAIPVTLTSSFYTKQQHKYSIAQLWLSGFSFIRSFEHCLGYQDICKLRVLNLKLW